MNRYIWLLATALLVIVLAVEMIPTTIVNPSGSNLGITIITGVIALLGFIKFVNVKPSEDSVDSEDGY